mmetsp:Transcript_96727/g.279233  ORF Transcript_96727/g.279233 Transcript_96727/m.279233 type:complete len:229 (+) Transcript_96727:684-1370(+)
MKSSNFSVFGRPLDSSRIFSIFCSSSSAFRFSSSLSRTGSISFSRSSYNMEPFDNFSKAVCICCRCSARANRSLLRSSATRAFSSAARRRSSAEVAGGLLRKPPMAFRCARATSASSARTAASAEEMSSDCGCKAEAAARSRSASSDLPWHFRATPRRNKAFARNPAPIPFLDTSAIDTAFPATSSALLCSPILRCTCAKLQYKGIKRSFRSILLESTKSSTYMIASL